MGRDRKTVRVSTILISRTNIPICVVHGTRLAHEPSSGNQNPFITYRMPADRTPPLRGYAVGEPQTSEHLT